MVTVGRGDRKRQLGKQHSPFAGARRAYASGRKLPALNGQQQALTGV